MSINSNNTINLNNGVTFPLTFVIKFKVVPTYGGKYNTFLSDEIMMLEYQIPLHKFYFTRLNSNFLIQPVTSYLLIEIGKILIPFKEGILPIQ